MQDKSPDPPPVPNPVAIANAQGASNLNTAIGSQILNQTGQNTPYGSVAYNQTGSYTTPDGTVVPSFTQNTTLSPNQQAILSQTEGLQKSALGAGEKAIANVSNTIGTPFDLKNLPALQSSAQGGTIQSSFQNPSQQMKLDTSKLPGIPGINDFGAQRDQVEQALMQRFNQDWTQQQANTTSRLNAQGLQQGSEAYNSEMDTLNRARNDALSQAILGAGTEQQRMFDMASQARGQMFGETLGAGNFANQAAGQQFGQNQALAGFGNAAANQQYTQNLSNAQLSNQARGQSVSEQALARSQPINEFATLFGLGGGVQVPQGAQQSGVGINPADILGANALQYSALQNTYNQQMQNRSSLGNLFGMLGGGALAGGYI